MQQYQCLVEVVHCLGEYSWVEAVMALVSFVVCFPHRLAVGVPSSPDHRTESGSTYRTRNLRVR